MTPLLPRSCKCGTLYSFLRTSFKVTKLVLPMQCQCSANLGLCTTHISKVSRTDKVRRDSSYLEGPNKSTRETWLSNILFMERHTLRPMITLSGGHIQQIIPCGNSASRERQWKTLTRFQGCVGSCSQRIWGWSRLRTCQTVPQNTLVDWNMLKTTNELARIRYQEEVQNTPPVHKYHLQNR